MIRDLIILAALLVIAWQGSVVIAAAIERRRGPGPVTETFVPKHDDDVPF